MNTNNEPPAKKRKLNNAEHVEPELEQKDPEEIRQKKQKKKPAAPYELRAVGYHVGEFQLDKRARCVFKALFGSNRLTVAWSDVTLAEARECYQDHKEDEDDFDRSEIVMNLLERAQMFRVEIDIDSIECIQISDGGDSVRLDIVTNAIPMFSKQRRRNARNNKFAKSSDRTNGNAIKYKKHSIFIRKQPTLSNMQKIEKKLKNGSERLKQLFDEEVYKQYEDVTMRDVHDENLINAAQSNEEEPVEDQSNISDGDRVRKARERFKRRKRKREKEEEALAAFRTPFLMTSEEVCAFLHEQHARK